MDVPNHDLTPQIRLNLWPGGFWHLAQTLIQPQFREGSYPLRPVRNSSPPLSLPRRDESESARFPRTLFVISSWPNHARSRTFVT